MVWKNPTPAELAADWIASRKDGADKVNTGHLAQFLMEGSAVGRRQLVQATRPLDRVPDRQRPPAGTSDRRGPPRGPRRASPNGDGPPKGPRGPGGPGGSGRPRKPKGKPRF